eukprot:6234051-Amphidinium_carterae.1
MVVDGMTCRSSRPPTSNLDRRIPQASWMPLPMDLAGSSHQHSPQRECRSRTSMTSMRHHLAFSFLADGLRP